MGGVNNLVYHKEDLDRFLDQLKKYNGNVTRAAKAAQFKGGRTVINRLRGAYPIFDEDFQNTMEEIYDEIEEYATRKAIKSDAMARFMLVSSPRGRARGFGKVTALTGKDGGPIQWKEFFESVTSGDDA